MPPIEEGRVSVAAVWPASTLGTADGVGAVESGVLIVELPDAPLVVVTGVDAESVISTSNVYEPGVIPDGVTQDMPKFEDAVPDGVAHCEVVAAA